MSLLMTLREGGIVVSFRDLLRFLDRYPMDVPIKGVQAVGPRVIVITTNVEPRDWYPWEDFAPWSDVLTRLDAGMLDEMLILFYHNKIHFFTTVSTQIDLILDLRRLAAAEMDTGSGG